MKIRLNKHRSISGCIGGSSNSNTSQPVTTASGSAQVQGDRGTAAQPGSIAVGAGAKYQEQGSVDLSNARTGNGTTVNIVPQEALQTFTDALQSAAAGSGGGGSSSQPVILSPPATGTVSYKTLGLIAAGIAAIIALISIFRGKRT